MRVGSTTGKTAGGVKDPSELTRSEQDDILRLVAAEKKSAKKKTEDKPAKPPVASKYAVQQPPIASKYAVQQPPVASKYAIQQPPVASKYAIQQPPVVAKYAVVPGPIVAKYAVTPPWAGVDAHQSVINKVVKDGYLNAKEATTLAKLFNRDIAHAQKEGRDISKQVANFLHSVLDKVKTSDKARNIVFGPGGPGYQAPGPVYIMAPR